ncbi:hypothetical protein DXG03_003838, partial [Asterophora parasitica]
MAIENLPPAPQLAKLDASRLVITESTNKKELPENPHFGEVKTDHMLVVNYEPKTGWSAPEIKPYGPLSLDPASSCFHYCPNVFEGMKPFDKHEVLKLIRTLVALDDRWVPTKEGHSLYIRPTIIGTRAALGVAASDSAMLFVMMTPTRPYFQIDAKGLPLLAVGKTVRSWPGGTGGYKLGLNYAPGIQPQREATAKGYAQILWLLGDDEKITEAGAMNFFAVVQREDGDLDIVTPPLDGTILPGITRRSALELLEAHTAKQTVLPGIPSAQRLHTHERAVTMHDLAAWSEEGKLLEAFC